MDVAKSTTEDFVTVVSVESQPPPIENFVTVLSIGNGKKDDEPAATLTKNQVNGVDGPLEEEVEVFRLPGERLGFGLKFEGGNKTSERVRRLFVQSCAEQSPASRAKCSWGTLGEGDEVLSIDGVPVTHMTRLDCVRRLKESQLVIKLMVRCRGALRPEVVSAEKKTCPEKSKVPPELPSAPPPVPPRKLRQARGLADGEANPSPVKKSWNGSRSQSSSQTSSPSNNVDSKSTSFESCESSPKILNGSVQESPKGSPKERSPELAKSKQEPPEAMVYVDARSQCGSTHGSTSDDTGSSMSTVIDRFSTSDRVSTISTVSTASTASEQPGEFSRIDQDFDRSSNSDLQLSKIVCPFDNLDTDYASNPPDYLLRRLASSEAVTHVESRGEVEKVTAVVAPNTVLIEETITFQPPLSFQDAPLSYGHEARPDLFYTADLAADSTTHFRPIKDDVELVERVNSVHEDEYDASDSTSALKGRGSSRTPPPLPVRNHVNRISVNQTSNDRVVEQRQQRSSPETSDTRSEAPVLPPKPLPRRDVKVRRKRPPPPPPPPTVVPRTDVKTSSSFETEDEEPSRTKIEASSAKPEEDASAEKVENGSNSLSRQESEVQLTFSKNFGNEGEDFGEKKRTEETDDTESMENYDVHEDDGPRTNKVLEIIEIRKAKAFSPLIANSKDVKNKLKHDENERANGDSENVKRNERIKPEMRSGTISTDMEDSEEEHEMSTKFNEPIDMQSEASDHSGEMDSPSKTNAFDREIEDYRSCNDIDLHDLNVNRTRNEKENVDEEDTSEESDDGDYYWQSNLATIGEEEETNSLEYTNANKGASDSESNVTEKPECQESPGKKDSFNTNGRNDEVDSANRNTNFPEAVVEDLKADPVNGRMDNCGGGQRLPPDGDEFPAAYQEFGGNNQQYRFVTAATTAARTSTIMANGRVLCNENESFNESFKQLENNVVNASGMILADARVALNSVENVCQEVGKIGLPSIEINGKMSIESVCQDAGVLARESRVDDAKPFIADDFVKKTTSVTNYSSYGNQSNGNVVVSEKKIEITGYYHKDPVIEQLQEEKDTMDTPPPLPLTGPPKLETVVPYSRNVPILESSPRKFSLNGELWRKDDKSEKSVRDKIAMFSSQSSLDGPLFPNTVTVVAATNNTRRLSKYKSSEDVCNDEKSPGQKERASFFADRTQSSFDLTDSSRNVGQDSVKKYRQRSPSITQSPSFASPTLIHVSKTFPIVPQKPIASTPTPLISSFETSPVPKSPIKSYCSPANGQNSPSASLKPVTSSVLSRATSFSGSSPYGQDRGSTTNELSSSSQITRTNSLASTFKRPNEEIRRNSLNQLIEQRRRSISKLRGLVIPEKESIPIDTPIVDLPEIKSRDSILLHQLPKASIQDKWGSQSSLASNASTASMPVKTTSFKMPAPQIHSKYSPAFKRKSLAVYGSSSTNSSPYSSATKSTTLTTTTSATSTPTPAATPTLSEPPKSLESICSPTRSDYSFEFASTASSPEGLRNRPLRTGQRKTRMDYDDSDNDSAVSSSQSSISRGFSPPMSPVPSERSTVSSERSYVSTETSYPRRALIVDSSSRSYGRESSVEFTGRSNILNERTFVSERSSSSSSGSEHRSPLPTSESNPRTSQIPQRQLKRSNSTETNCSTSSTLTSGSQASAESLSRRVLKPQSVEAINRKNILASARCRSGRDLNGSPLIQRKFPEDECRASITENGDDSYQRNYSKDANAKDVKIAYIEVTDSFGEDESFQKQADETKLSPKRSVSSKYEAMEPSNDLKMWVRTEAKALARSAVEKSNKVEKKPQEVDAAPVNSPLKNGRAVVIEEQQLNLSSTNRNAGNEGSGSPEASKQRRGSSITPKTRPEDQNDLLTILTTKSRSRSAIHVDDGSFGRSKSQMSLEDILSAKADPKLPRTPTGDSRTEKNIILANPQPRSLWESRDNRYIRRSSSTSNEPWSEDKPSKIPTLNRSKLDSSGDEITEVERSKSLLSKIPTARSLGRRSASVTDMKKALEKIEVNCSPNQGAHNRFPSLDSSVDESVSPVGTDADTDRCCSEQFGSISSLASSTSLISQQELAQLVEEASLEEVRGAHDVIVVLLHKENHAGSVGITLAGGADCEIKEITVHRVLAHSIADKDGRVQRGDRILSINGRSTQGLTHRESIAVLKQPRSEVVLVVSRARAEEGGCKLKSRTASVETIIEGFETNDAAEDTAWGPPSVVAVYKDGAGLGFSLEGGRDSPLGDRPLVIKKIFTGGAAEKTGALKAGDQLLEVNGYDVTRMSRIEAWSLMKKLHDGEVNLLVRHPATKSS